MRLNRALPTLLALCLLPFAAPAQQPARPTSTPYSGDLSIFDTPGREERLDINRVMDLLKIAPGKNVADIGAGSGWFTIRAAHRVLSSGAGAASGTVFAEDINPAAITFIDERAKRFPLTNVHTVLGTPDDPKLPSASVDAVLMLKVYHEIARPIPFMQTLRASLRPNALVGIIDRNGSGTDHGLNRTILEHEMTLAGFREIGHYDFTKKDNEDYFLIFVAK